MPGELDEEALLTDHRLDEGVSGEQVGTSEHRKQPSTESRRAHDLVHSELQSIVLECMRDSVVTLDGHPVLRPDRYHGALPSSLVLDGNHALIRRMRPDPQLLVERHWSAVIIDPVARGSHFLPDVAEDDWHTMG